MRRLIDDVSLVGLIPCSKTFLSFYGAGVRKRFCLVFRCISGEVF